VSCSLSFWYFPFDTYSHHGCIAHLAHIDTLTENSVQEALDRLGTDRTVLVIAHRLGTIRNADNIVVLKDGVAAEQGTHDELLAANGIYADMWNMQLNSTSASASRTNLNSPNQPGSEQLRFM